MTTFSVTTDVLLTSILVQTRKNYKDLLEK